MSGSNTTGNIIKNIISALVAMESVIVIIGIAIALISVMTGLDKVCYLRYNFDVGATSYSLQNTVQVNATGNYSSISTTVNDRPSFVPNPNTYGQWVQSNVPVQSGKPLKLSISGWVSLCRSYLPQYNLQSDSNLNSAGNLIPIPRLEENTPPAMLFFDARNPGWSNVAEVYVGDAIEVILNDNVNAQNTTNSSTVVYTDSITNVPTTANCAQGRTQYSPLCGRWSMFKDTSKAIGCYMDKACMGSNYYDSTYDINSPQYGQNHRITTGGSVCNGWVAVNGRGVATNWCSGDGANYPYGSQSYFHDAIWQAFNCYAPMSVLPYQDNGSTTYAASVGITNFPITGGGTTTCGQQGVLNGLRDRGDWLAIYIGRNNWYGNYPAVNSSCASLESQMCNGTPYQTFMANLINGVDKVPTGFQNRNGVYNGNFRPWFTATDAAGLLYRFDTSLNPTNRATMGASTSYTIASIIGAASDEYRDSYTGRKVFSGDYAQGGIGYLQFRFYGESPSNNTGGYVMGVKHTKCKRMNGNALTDSYPNRGGVQYVITTGNPNTDSAIAANAEYIGWNSADSAIVHTDEQSGSLWFKIDNNFADYKDSFGQYSIQISTIHTGGSFTLLILTPIFDLIRNKLNSVATQIFSNMTCYQQTVTSSCTNFFNYIRALLTLYIMSTGFLFLIGSQKITQEELVKRVVKVAIVGGLINGQTFEFFSSYIFPFVTGFSDAIIADMSGFSMLSSTNTISNPFMFLDSLMSRIFFSPTFLAQLLAIMSMGLPGIIYFIIVCASVVVFIISILRAMAVYIMAMIAVAFLISIGPIFLTFMLFDRTFYLFENWLKFLFKYMMEPVIVLAGIIILTQLFSLFVDQVLSYSVCWKCALAFMFPFASVFASVFPGLETIPIFCFYWFGAWGLSPGGDIMGMDMGMMTGMVITGFAAYGYIDLAAKMSSRLCGDSGPSAIGAGIAMAHDKGQQFLGRYGLDDQNLARMKQAKDSRGKAQREAIKTERKASEKDAKKDKK